MRFISLLDSHRLKSGWIKEMETSISLPTINETFLWCFARYFDVEVHEMSNHILYQLFEHFPWNNSHLK